MRRALCCLALAFAACQPAVGPSAFVCTQSADCSPGWFCAQDNHCHDDTRADPLACAADTDCGAGWHCGKEKICYDLEAVVDLAPCRRDAGLNVDCGPRFRCGIDDQCHPVWDAGAIPCAYEADFADCTNGWRCSFTQRCLDPAAEALEPYSRQLSEAVLISNILPAAEITAVSAGDSDAGAVATLDDAGLTLFRRIRKEGAMVGPPSTLEDFTGHTFTVTRFSLTGTITPPITTTNELVTFFQNGVLSRARFDGGLWVVKAADGGTLTNAPGAGQRTVFELRPLSGEGLAAFRTDGGGYWTISADAGASWVNRPALVDVLELPSAPGSTCALVGYRTPTSVHFDAVGTSCGSQQLDVSSYSRGSLQVGLGNLIASFEVPPGAPMDPSGPTSVLHFFSPPAVDESCKGICAGGYVEQLWPHLAATGEKRAELLCSPFDGGIDDRWWSLVEISDFRCLEQPVDRLGRQFLAGHLSHPNGPANSGNYSRYQANFSSGNGQAWVMGPGGSNSFLDSESWFLDRPPLAVGVFTIGVFPDGGLNQVVLSSTRSTTGALTPAGFLAESQQLGIVAGIITPGGLVGFTTRGELNYPLTGRILARVSLSPFPKEAEQHVIVAPRAGGGDEWIVSVDDQLFTGTVATTGRVVELVPAARPAPGFPIISLTASSQAVAFGDTVEFYAATRSSVYRLHLDRLNRWHADTITLATDTDLVEVWTTPSNRLRVGDRVGRIFSLPSGLLLARARAQPVEDFLTVCGRDVALFTDDAWVLGPAVDGIAAWEPLRLTPDLFKGGRLFEVVDGFLVFGARGDVQKVNCTP